MTARSAKVDSAFAPESETVTLTEGAETTIRIPLHTPSVITDCRAPNPFRTPTYVS